MSKMNNLIKNNKPTPKKITILIVALLIIGYFGYKTFGKKQAPVQYQTGTAEKGALVTSVSASGNISSGSIINITTNATGLVNNLYVKVGDTVTQGEKIADVTLDQDSQQRLASAWSSYLSANNQLKTAQANINQLQAALFKANQAFMNDAVANGLATVDPTYIQEDASWLQAEANYKNQADVITQAQAALNSAWLNYQQMSSTITAPASGVIGNLIITTGLPITSTQSTSTTSNTNSATTQIVGTIIPPDQRTQAVVDLSEIDAAKVKVGQKATMTLSAFPNQTYTGKVMLIDTNGTVSSGVTTYHTTIVFDTGNPNIYPNMAVDANIITNIKNDIVMVPTAAIQTTNGQPAVRIMKNGKASAVTVQTGDSNDSQTEIVSGVNEGDTVVTGVTSQGTSTQGSGTSPFGVFGGGGATRVRIGG